MLECTRRRRALCRIGQSAGRPHSPRRAGSTRCIAVSKTRMMRSAGFLFSGSCHTLTGTDHKARRPESPANPAIHSGTPRLACGHQPECWPQPGWANPSHREAPGISSFFRDSRGRIGQKTSRKGASTPMRLWPNRNRSSNG